MKYRIFFFNSLIFHFRLIHKLSYTILNEEHSRIHINLWKIIYILRNSLRCGDTFTKEIATITITYTFANLVKVYIYIYFFIITIGNNRNYRYFKFKTKFGHCNWKQPRINYDKSNCKIILYVIIVKICLIK